MAGNGDVGAVGSRSVGTSAYSNTDKSNEQVPPRKLSDLLKTKSIWQVDPSAISCASYHS